MIMNDEITNQFLQSKNFTLRISVAIIIINIIQNYLMNKNICNFFQYCICYKKKPYDDDD